MEIAKQFRSKNTPNTDRQLSSNIFAAESRNKQFNEPGVHTKMSM